MRTTKDNFRSIPLISKRRAVIAVEGTTIFNAALKARAFSLQQGPSGRQFLTIEDFEKLVDFAQRWYELTDDQTVVLPAQSSNLFWGKAP